MIRVFRSAALLLLFFCAAGPTAQAQTDQNVLAKYNFEHLNDEGLKDLSGNGNDATAVCDESCWVKTAEGSSLKLKDPADKVLLPPGAFPGSKGYLKMAVIPDDAGGNGTMQVLFRVYGKGDGLTLALRDGKLVFSYYNRAAAKSSSTYLPASELAPGQPSEIIAGWDVGNKLFLSINGHMSQIPVSAEPNFEEGDQGNQFILGNDNGARNPFTGNISAFEIGKDFPELSSAPPKIQSSSGAVAARTNEPEMVFAPDDLVRVHNPSLEFAFSKKDGMPVGSARGPGNDIPLLAKPARGSDLKLWEIVLAKDFGRGDSVVISPADASAPPTLERAATEDLLSITWPKVRIRGTSDSAEVVVKVDLKQASPLSMWRISVKLSSPAFGINEVHFPLLAIAPPSHEPDKVQLAVPYRWGQLLPDAFRAGQTNTADSYPAQYIYPTANMSMQFFAYCGPERTGTYVATYDGGGYVKQYNLVAKPSRKRVDMMIINHPHDRSAAAYEMPYPVVIGGFQGDWYDASQMYRQWAVTQAWCAKGPIAGREDIPAWVKNSDLAIRMHTKDGRPIANNLYGALQLAKNLGGPILSNWYAWWEPNLAKTVTSSTGGYANAWGARTTEMRPGNKEALKELTDAGVYSCAYINTVTYDQGAVLDAEAHLLENSVTIDKSGKPMIYDPKSLPMWLMSRNSPKWQDYYANLCAETIKLGFAGIYMDSFGRSSIFSYAAEPGAPVASGDGPSIGQLQMGAKVRAAIRKVNSEAAMVGEASSEQFIAMIDANLLHVNVMDNECPLWMAVYHDYQVLFGRSFGTDQDSDQSFRQRVGNLFLLGAIPGRIFVEGSSAQKAEAFPFRQKEAAQLDFLKRVVAFRKKDRDFLGYGQMLRPATISPAPALAMTGSEKASVPEIMTSSWKSSSGKAAVFVMNSTMEQREITLHFDTADYGFSPEDKVSITRQTADSEEALPQTFQGSSEIKCALSGADIVVYVLSRQAS